MQTSAYTWRQYGWGLALAGFIAAAAIQGATLPTMEHWGLSALTLAILIGIVLGNTVFSGFAKPCAAGVDFSKTKLLRIGIVLFGFRITFQQISDVGLAGILIDILIIGCTFLLAVQLGTRLFKLDRQTAMLIGAGSSICGAAAVMAAEPVVHGQAHKVSVAVATVVIFGTLGMFIYPLFYPYLHLSEVGYGMYAGSTIHEVAQVVVAGKSVSDLAASTAVIEKMLRVMMLAPFLVLLSNRISHEDDATKGCRHITIPWFAVFFIVTSGIHSLHLVPEIVVHWIIHTDTVLLAMAMSALGLRTHVGAVRQAGLKPILLASTLFLFLMIGGYIINRIVTTLLA
ncbi:YeiH family protein [Noviherbaspirillum pedocola]|uniref:YeiH family putative sulfate export transporter n=1 Tax=Noviherbaspirillum pedocola TaxID=2801341 RepID=A0A934W4Y2_9BURK|nr:YeiH family protein [Noviherbaspirillum pedocola]MBK4739031.1 YeiH family putative sulfate export transporter [Noviherbaspirillum pedocola]